MMVVSLMSQTSLFALNIRVNMCMTLYEQLNLLHDEHPNALVQPVHLLHDGGSIDVSNFVCALNITL